MYTNLEYQKRKTRGAIVWIAAIALIFSAFSPIFSATDQPMNSSEKMQTEKNLFNIVAIGDSLAVGYEKGFTDQSKPFGVGEQLHEQALFQGYRASYTNFGILGLTSDGLLRWLTAAQQGKTISAADLQAGLKDPRVDTLLANTSQFKQQLASANLIVLAIGGNDFLQILTKLDLDKPWSSWSETEREQLQADITETTAQYESKLSSILSIIHELNADAVVVTQNQYLPLPKLNFNGTEGYIGVDSNLAKLLLEARAEINRKFDEVVSTYEEKGMSIQYIDAASVIESNSLGLTAIASGDIHPNAAGYKKLSEQYSKLIWGEHRQVQERREGIPLSVVVNGKEVISQYPTKLINGRTYLVLSDITKAIGAGLSWSNKTETATITIGERVVELKIGSNTYKVNGQTYKLNAEPAFLAKVNHESKTYVPVAALTEGLGLFTEYFAQTKTVFVNK